MVWFLTFHCCHLVIKLHRTSWFLLLSHCICKEPLLLFPDQKSPACKGKPSPPGLSLQPKPSLSWQNHTIFPMFQVFPEQGRAPLGQVPSPKAKASGKCLSVLTFLKERSFGEGLQEHLAAIFIR